ncbi:M28 family peptidase [Amycolatopsis anabasis]|uniref:M28 family peptidase n=1 Tax=Amycolatopsis anabasis TaxID=1840409 RepID=UPI00131B9362|nr:M28 family peptidase [Amycolatopsis anabasis]
MHPWTRASALGIAATTVISLLVATPATAAEQNKLPGFTVQHSAAQRALEQKFLQAIDPAQARELSTVLSERPRLVGTDGARWGAEYSRAKLREWGLDANLRDYSVYGSVPKNIDVRMTAPQQRQLEVMEHPYPGQQHLDEAVVGYNAYSPAGDVTGKVVYANYGLPEDYQKLAELGVDVRDKVVLVRYGNSFRGVKSKVAEEHGAKGVLIYSDPADDGFVRGPVYPNGPWRPADAIQRGSVQYIFNYPGDPLTPGEPSVPGTDRLDPADARNLPRIPTTPISYGQAEPLLKALAGPSVPKNWQGGLNFGYHVGPGPTEARLNLDIDYEQLPVHDVVAEIKGSTHPEQKVIIGAHQDAWVYGTNDNTSGWVSAMQIAYGLSQLLKTGWRPQRTIVIAGWDGEEYGLLGSTEWAEQHRFDLLTGAVSYLNMDGTAGKDFSAAAVPSLDDLVTAVTKDVPDPDHGTVYANWVAATGGKPKPGRLGSGSDYTAFLDHLGISSAGVGFDSGSGEYHSTIDDLDMTERFLDPGFVHHSAAAETTGLVGLRLTEADVLPMNYSGYATAVQGYLGEVAKRGLDVSSAVRAAQEWQRAAGRLENAREQLTSGANLPPSRADRMNRALLWQERSLTNPLGLPGRDWYKHQVYAPGEYTGYASQPLPAINAALDKGDRATAQRYLSTLTLSLYAATALARTSG